MLKMVFIASRKPGLSSEEFRLYWRETHAPTASSIPGLTRYVQHIHPDGDRFVVAGGAAGTFYLVTNWFEELRQRVG